MEENYNLNTIFVLDAMHDQRVDKIEVNNNMLIVHFGHLAYYEPLTEKAKEYYNKHVKYHTCDVKFLDVDRAYAEVTKKNKLFFKGRIYYMDDFVEYLAVDGKSGDLSAV